MGTPTSVKSPELPLDDFWAWLKGSTAIQAVGDWTEVTTPFLDRHNDCLQVYGRWSGDRWQMTDDAYTLRDLENCGCEIRAGRRRDMLDVACRNLGVEVDPRDQESLIASALTADFPQKLLGLIQAMLVVNDLFYLAPASVQSIFLEDVSHWLSEHHINFVTIEPLIGKSRIPRRFDFLVPATENAPDRYVQTVNRPGKSSIDDLLLAWSDTTDVRPTDSVAFALLNDSCHNIKSRHIDAMLAYGVNPIRWSKRSGLIHELAG